MTKFISYYARKSNLLAVFFLVFGTSIFLIPTAQAAQANTSVICANPAGEERSYQIGWDNSNQFFADKGYIPRFYCEGGYANPYRTYISDTLNGGPLGYFQGLVPVVSEPTPVAPSDTSTATSETQTATADTSTSTSDTTTSSSDTTTTTSQQETPTVTPQPTETSTTPSPVDGSTATSEPAPQPAPIPVPPPVVEPTPEPEPVVQPEEVLVPEPNPEPEIPISEELPELIEESVDSPSEPPVVEEETIPQEESVVLDNGVVLTPEVAAAVVLLQDPVAFIGELFTNPAAALAALGSVGADMSPEVREKSKKVVISAVIAGNIATQAAASAGAVAAYRRK